MSTITIGILTLNEAQRIERCINSAKWADQIVVVDSGSSDKTIEIATSMGAQVHVHADWQGFAHQRNHVLSYCKSDYLFFLDADEELTAELSQEIKEWVVHRRREVGRIAWQQVAFGRHLSAMSAKGRLSRLFERTNLLRFEGVVHEWPVLVDASVGTHVFKHRLPHYSRETVHGSLLKLAQYAQLGAVKRRADGKTGGILRGAASALANFFRLYIWRRGFLCGAEGFLHCFFVSLECFFRYAAIKYDKRSDQLLVKR